MKSLNTNLVSLIFLIFNFSIKANDIKLAQSVSNNAVTLAEVNLETVMFSFNGLSQGKTYKDIIASGYSYNLVTGESKTLPNLPDGVGRLASIAVNIKNRVLVIGGYSVAKDHSEKSTSEIFEYLPKINAYRLITKMPVPVDDTVALVYQERFLYLVSGWFDDDNVSLVQVYDLEKDHWFNATPFPGAAVFGHAGGIIDNTLLIADGVKVVQKIAGKRTYGISNENWKGVINLLDPSEIKWQRIDKHPYKPHYRMAAKGVKKDNLFIFTGGSDNPYNFNGIGYDGNPSTASNLVFAYDLSKKEWRSFEPKASKSMDHRGLLEFNGFFYILGGMGNEQQTLSTIQKFEIKE